MSSIFENFYGVNLSTFNNHPTFFGAVFFVGGCNLRCSWCHNKKIVLKKGDPIDKEILQDFIKRCAYYQKKFGDFSLTITGGEPTIYSDLPNFLDFIKNDFPSIKLDSNGINYNMLKDILKYDLANLIAIDIKYPPQKYAQYLDVSGDFLYNIFDLSTKYKNKFLFRTTLNNELSLNDTEEIDRLIKRYNLQHNYQKFIEPTETWEDLK